MSRPFTAMRSDPDDNWEARKERIIGLGERSFRKTYYPQLRQNLDRLERFRTLLDRTSDFVILVDLEDGSVVDANAALGRLLGEPFEALIGRPFASLGLANTRAMLELLRREMADSVNGIETPTHSLDTRFAAADTPHSHSASVWLEISYRIARVDERSYGILVGRDITERKSHEEAMAALLTEKQALLDNVQVGIVMLRQRRIVTCNRRFEEIFGYPAGAMIGQSTRILYPSEDTFSHIGEAAYDRLSSGQNFKATLIMVRADGSEFWATLNGRAIDPAHPRDGSIWIYSDDTEARRAEQNLRIAATAFESLEGMTITDARGVILRVNKAFTEITGYSAEEAVGNTPRLLNSGRHNKAFYTAMWKRITRSGSWRGEIWNRRKNGEIYPIYLSITAVKGDDGAVSHYVGTFTDTTERKAAAEKIEYLAFHDPLTDLPNRRLMLDRLGQALISSARRNRQGALMLIDLDNFKTLNDTLGHSVGDQLLVEAASRLQSGIRDSDTVARLGGDEFVIILEDLEGNGLAASQAENVATKIMARLDQPYLLDINLNADGTGKRSHHCTSSIGITLFGGQSVSVDELMKRADTAMYQAKAAGRNTLRFFDPDMQAAVTARAAMEADLRKAIAEKQFVLHYQAQVDAAGWVTGAEVLVRWQHPERGLVPPAEFITLAEDTGLILPLGHWVMETACAQLAAWAIRTATAHLTLAVNVSARQFSLPNLVEQVRDLIRSTGAPPDRLKLELTESLLLEHAEDIINKMIALKALGVGFSLDDFGTGYSSLSYLKRLPLDQLKIDQSFVRDVLTDPNDAAIARTIVALARSLGLAVIAEGVETAAQRDFLATIGCLAYQGYFFSRPLPLDGFEAFLQSAQGAEPAHRSG